MVEAESARAKPYKFRPRTSSGEWKAKAKPRPAHAVGGSSRTGGPVRCQMELPDRAKARFLYKDCDLNFEDIGYVLKASPDVVAGAVRNEYSHPDNTELDAQYVPDEFRREYLKFKNDVEILPPSKSCFISRFDSPLSEYDYGETSGRLSTPVPIPVRNPIPLPRPKPVPVVEHPVATPVPIPLPVRPPTPASLLERVEPEDSSPQPSPSPVPDVLESFLAHDISPYISLAHHKPLFQLVGLGLYEICAMTAWSPAEISETLTRLLAHWPSPDSDSDTQGEDGLSPVELILLENTIRTIELAEEYTTSKPFSAPATLEDFLAHPMPGFAQGVNLMRHHELFLTSGMRSVGALRAVGELSIGVEGAALLKRSLRKLYEGHLDPFELMLVELGIRRLRDWTE
ncbi:hypothetical protein HMN09_00136200 [Mycena chlorophos]|uniref:Uncharacterized protein n=1 Tax=Mycena chlorophos TaxID=658473 RepID=A0A8H6TKB1_MYCCL|nr:hypothetical protein HMN09_00136200 [Mycena chlorophos]